LTEKYVAGWLSRPQRPARCPALHGASAPEEEAMKKRIAVLASAMVLAASGVASASITPGPGKGNPDTNPTGKCPPGQNADTSPGGLKKCS
jgi:hypothetical protein